jgi:hypothetical protein
MEEDEAEASESGESEEEASGSEESGTDDESEERPRRKQPFKPPPPREMPQRMTRGLRMGNLVQARLLPRPPAWRRCRRAQDRRDRTACSGTR